MATNRSENAANRCLAQGFAIEPYLGPRLRIDRQRYTWQLQREIRCFAGHDADRPPSSKAKLFVCKIQSVLAGRQHQSLGLRGSDQSALVENLQRLFCGHSEPS